MREIKRYIEERGRMIEEALDHFLPSQEMEPKVLHRAMRYTIFAGGKRLRPLLTLAAAECLGCEPERALPPACALELIHTYSLIHDDLPAMDNDNYRRGKPTSHRVFGEAVAILAGDALLTEAFRLLTDTELNKGLDSATLLKVSNEVAQAIGSLGMVGGQTADLTSGITDISPEWVEWIHHQKTGRLIQLAVRVGGMIGGADPERLELLSRFGRALGLAFQISDDILDGSAPTSKKGVTYTSVVGVAKARQRFQGLIDEALEAIAPFDERADPLRGLAKIVLSRVD